MMVACIVGTRVARRHFIQLAIKWSIIQENDGWYLVIYPATSPPPLLSRLRCWLYAHHHQLLAKAIELIDTCNNTSPGQALPVAPYIGGWVHRCHHHPHLYPAFRGHLMARPRARIVARNRGHFARRIMQSDAVRLGWGVGRGRFPGLLFDCFMGSLLVNGSICGSGRSVLRRRGT